MLRALSRPMTSFAVRLPAPPRHRATPSRAAAARGPLCLRASYAASTADATETMGYERVPDEKEDVGGCNLRCASQRATEKVARMLAASARAGDVICLHGDVGAGKSVFSRAYVRAVAEDARLEVPSPTYLLQQVYDAHCERDAKNPKKLAKTSRPPVHHFDLYRVDDDPARAAKRLGLKTSFAEAACVVEWAERLRHLAPAHRLDVYVSMTSGARKAGQVEVKVSDEEDEEEEGGEGGGEGEGGEEEEEEEIDPAFVDARPRLIKLRPRSQEWVARVGRVHEKLMYSR